MNIVIKNSWNVSNDFIYDVMKLDEIAYSSDLQGTYDSINARYQKNKESYILAYHKEKLVGYLCFFPITVSLYNEILVSNVIKDDDIQPSSITSYKKNKNNNIFIISTVIKPNYRDGEVIKLMTNSLVEFINKKENEGYKINSIIGTVVSKDGFKLLKMLNFKVYKFYETGYKLMITKEVKLNLNN